MSPLRPPSRAPNQGDGDRDRPSPRRLRVDRDGLHPWLILAAAVAAATRSQPGGASMPGRDDPGRAVRSKWEAHPRLLTRWPEGATKLRPFARARPARCRIAPDRRDRAQAVCRLNSPPIPHLNANHSRHHRIQSGNPPGRRRNGQCLDVPVCDRVPNRNRPTEPPTLVGNMAKGRNRRRGTFANGGPVIPRN